MIGIYQMNTHTTKKHGLRKKEYSIFNAQCSIFKLGHRVSGIRTCTSAFPGIALVAVLAILTVLAIMASAFVTLMNIERKQSKVQANSQQLDMLVGSGLEHAKAILTVDEIKTAGNGIFSYDILNFTKSSSDNNFPNRSKWVFVKDDTGEILGRYRIRIEDEAGKVNVQKAFLTKKSKGTGWDTGEIVLPNALGTPAKTAMKLIDYRYGKNKLPGARGDDNHNNLILMADGIDNNANGIIDEPGEGINDPKEYSAEHLQGDDSKFSSMTELMSTLIGEVKLSPDIQRKIAREIPRRATIYSCDYPGSPTLPDEYPSDINSITPRECRKLLIKANAVNPFEPNSSKQMLLAAGLVDYRDENHVLSTLGSTYGVEAICFNEIFANDETYTVDPSYAIVPNLDKKYWRNNCGSIDGGRMFYLVDKIYDAVPDDPGPSYTIDPRKAWRISKKRGIGGIGDVNGEKITITFPKAIGRKGNKIEIAPYNIPVQPPDLPGNKSWCIWRKPGAVVGDKNQQEKGYRDLLKVLRKLNSAEGDRPSFPENYFRNSELNVYKWSDDLNDITTQKAIGCFKIISGNQRSITIYSKDVNTSRSFSSLLSSAGVTNDLLDLSLTINSWSPAYPLAGVSGANRTYLLRARKPRSGRYFKVIVGRPAKGRYTPGYPDDLGVSGAVGGKFTSDSEYEKQWVCNDGRPIKTRNNGWMKIMITSSPNVSRAKKNRQYISFLRVVGPEVVEMYNASATPISLANWRVICNTGTLATQIGRIRSTEYYDQKLRRGIIDDNPVVQPRGHFYLVNDKKLFDAEYGNADDKWGTAADEQVPVFQMDEQNWGVTYKIKSTRMSYGEGPKKDRWGYVININDNGVDKETFNLETIKFVDAENADDPDSWNNIFAPVLSYWIYKKNEIFIRPIGDDQDIIDGKLVGKSVMILGLPHSGGIVSLTLKNEYDQVCARTVDYGKVEVDELDVTTEKIDPTKTTWVKRKKHSIGGTENKAENRAMKNHHNDKFFIKNGPFGCIGEVKNISTGNDFERLGGSGNISKGANALGALANYMSSSHIRLESCLGDVVRTGWKQGYNEVANSSLRTVVAKNGGWEADMWKGQTLRFLSGPLRGEKFPIIGNSKKTLSLSQKDSKYIPRSAPGRKALKANKGDKFTIGPGYATPMCYTRKTGESGEWTWKNAVQIPGNYYFYLYGLNDAIDTTEFLEENNNASIDVELWNYKKQKYDMLKSRAKYGKQDSFNAGKIKPENTSPNGDVRMRLTAHNVVERNTDDKTGKTMVGSGGKQTGFAWFNYAVISPVPVVGRVNVNTASQRLLLCLPGINTELAKNIYEGIDSNGKKKLKPYHRLGDLFKVKGMTPEIFERCVNLLALGSSAFTIEVEAQLLKKSNEKADLNNDSIIASRQKRFVVMESEKADGALDISIIENCIIK